MTSSTKAAEVKTGKNIKIQEVAVTGLDLGEGENKEKRPVDFWLNNWVNESRLSEMGKTGG